MSTTRAKSLVAALLAALLVVPMTAGPTRAASTTLVVQAASQTPTATGLTVQAGQLVNFVTSGTWCMGGTPPTAECGTADGVRPANADEFPLVLDSAEIGELIGRVGSGPWFRIGSISQISMPNPGALVVLFNDRPCCYGDNSGSISLAAGTVVAPPGGGSVGNSGDVVRSLAMAASLCGASASAGAGATVACVAFFVRVLLAWVRPSPAS